MNNSIKAYGAYCVQRYNLQNELQDSFVAVTPEINQETQRVTWREGERGRTVDYDKITDCRIEFPSDENKSTKNLPTKITIVDNRTNNLYILEPLTLKIYRECIKERLSGHPDFASDKEMNDFFLNL